MSQTGLRLFCLSVTLPALFLFLQRPALAIDPRFELDPQQLDQKGTPAKPSTPATPGAKHAPKRERSSAGTVRYTIRPGDHLYRILMVEYGLSEARAEALIPKVKQLNGIRDIRRLKVGSSIVIPLTEARRKEHDHDGGHRRGGRHLSAKRETPSQILNMINVTGSSDTGVVSAARQVWDRLLPSSPGKMEGIEINGQNFDLSIDQDRFPTLPAADGGTILVDAGGRLPPLVRSLVTEAGDRVRIVSDDPASKRRFFASLLSAAHFFSVSENFSVDFGTDPQLTVTSDFKIEKRPDSLLKQDLTLLNVSEARSGMPNSLVSFLNRQGFEVIEPFPPARRMAAASDGNLIYKITGKSAPEVADRLMNALDIHYSRDTKVELYGPRDSGLRLDIHADRFFETGGERYVVSNFNGDPVFYTLMRLLETRGYRVIILEQKDDFKRVTEKFISRLRVPGSYAKQRLWPGQDAPYSIQMSGFMLRNPQTGKKIFLTGRDLDPLITELATLNGYTVLSGQD